MVEIIFQKRIGYVNMPKIIIGIGMGLRNRRNTMNNLIKMKSSTHRPLVGDVFVAQIKKDLYV